jgi:hypothetical protein
MRHHVLHTLLGAWGLALLLSWGNAQAQVYKWVDDQGRTHYSASKEDSERAKGSEVKIRDHTPSNVESKSYWEYVRGTTKSEKATSQTSTDDQSSSTPPRLSTGRDDGTDLSRCNIARDVLSGALRLRNGEPFGEFERKTAEEDIRRHCR